MGKVDEFLNKQVFDSTDLERIRNHPFLRNLFMIACMPQVRMSPKYLSTCWNLDVWKKREELGEIDYTEFYFESLYHTGGKCDVCEKEWKKKIVSLGKDETGKEVTIFQFEPGCKCYPRCVICKKWLMVEIKNREKGCRKCGQIRCGKIVPVKRRNKDGEETETKKMKRCSGLMVLKSAKDGYTVYECDDCGNIVKKEIFL